MEALERFIPIALRPPEFGERDRDYGSQDT